MVQVHINSEELSNVRSWNVSFKKKNDLNEMLEIHCELGSNLSNFCDIEEDTIIVLRISDQIIRFKVNRVGFIGMANVSNNLYEVMVAYGETIK